MKLVVAVIVALCATVATADEGAGTVTDLTDENFHHFLDDNEVVMVNFYANWCRFSQMLQPVYEQAAKLLGDSTHGRLARVNCEDPNAQLAKDSNHISKFPTLKLFRNGHPLKAEYRGQRSATAIEAYVRKLLAEPITKVESDEELNSHLRRSRRLAVGHFPNEDHPHRVVFHEVGQTLRDECIFVERLGVPEAKIEFRSKTETLTYPDGYSGPNEFLYWVREHCNPMVREITFENGEELTEEGLPFLILFHHPDDHDSVNEFTKVVKERFPEERGNINFITADGVKFSHPLKHLGKSTKDLPLLAFDTFKHMYMFKKFSNIRKPGKLEKFVADLHSGKLHHNFHHGVVEPDDDEDDEAEEETKPPSLKDKIEDVKQEKEAAEKHVEVLKAAEKATEHLDDEEDDPSKPVPVKSVLRKLKPAENRYSFRDDSDL